MEQTTQEYVPVEAKVCKRCDSVHPLGGCVKDKEPEQLEFDFHQPEFHYDEWTEEDERKMREAAKVRLYGTGATRDSIEGKYAIEEFLSPLVLDEYYRYMHENRKQSDGTLRAGDNWQKGIPKSDYIGSGLRHTHDWWMIHRGYEGREDIKKALCGVIFNAMGYLYEVLKDEEQRTNVMGQHS